MLAIIFSSISASFFSVKFTDLGTETPLNIRNAPSGYTAAIGFRDTDLTGREAYALYEEGVKKLLQEIGGGVGFEGDVERLALGEVEELWDVVALAVWPSRGVMFEVMQSPDMQAISVHRSAGLAGQINIETTGFQGLWLKDSDQ